MDFQPSTDQRAFAQSLTDLMRRADSVQVARAWAAGDKESGIALWRRIAEQGVTALVLPEADGGLGADLTDLCVAFEVLGHELAVGPWTESAALAPQAEGEMVTAAVPGVAAYAVDADVARLLHGRRGAQHRSVDTTRHLFDVAPNDAAFDSEALDRAALACAAELLGCGERLLADTVAYAGQRHQFGRAIGSYQAIKHRLADVRIALDFARPVVFGAALGAVPVAAAKTRAADAAQLAARTALQVHGAIGYTAELDLGLWINRVRALVGVWGAPGDQRAAIAERLLEQT